MAEFAPHFYNALAQRPFNLEPMQRAAETRAAAMQRAAENVLAAIHHRQEMQIAERRATIEEAHRHVEELRQQKILEAATGRNQAMEDRIKQMAEDSKLKYETLLKAAGMRENSRGEIEKIKQEGMNARLGTREAFTSAQGKAASDAVSQVLGRSLPPGMAGPVAASVGRMIQKGQEDQQKQAIADQHRAALGVGLKLRQDPDMNPMSTYTGSRVDVDPALQAIYAEGGPKALERHFQSKGMTPEDAAAEAKAALKPIDMPYVDPQKREMFEAAMANQGVAGPDVQNVSNYMFRKYAKNEMEAHDALLKNFNTQTGKGAGAAKTKGPEIELPSGGRIPDTTGFTHGGNLSDLLNDPKMLAEFQGAAHASGQRDKEYPSEQTVGAALAVKGGEQAVKDLTNKRLDVIHQHAQWLLDKYGWKRDEPQATPQQTPQAPMPGPQGGPAPQGAPTGVPTGPPPGQGGVPGPPSKINPADALRARIQAGEFGHQGNWDEGSYQAALKAMDLTNDQVMGGQPK